jgi:hypothetical protein
MPTFAEIAKKIDKLDFNKIAKEIFSNQFVANQIIETITGRLFAKGVTGDNIKLKTDSGTINVASRRGFYSPFTEFVKKEKGQPINRVTLKDLGKFYFSFKVTASTVSFRIDADFNKDEHMQSNFELLYSSEKAFEDSVTSLSEDELNRIILAHFTNEILKKINAQLS